MVRFLTRFFANPFYEEPKTSGELIIAAKRKFGLL